VDKILDIIRQSFISFSGEILIKILGFFFKLYLVHNLLDATLSLGIFALGIALIDFLSPFTSLGLGAVSTRYLPRWEVKKQVNYKNYFVSTATLIVLFLSLLLSLFIFLYKDKLLYLTNLIYKNSNQTIQQEFLYLIPIFLVIMVLKHQTSILNQFLIGFKELKKIVIYSSFIGFPLKFLLVIILLNLGLDLQGYLYSEIITLLFILISFIIILKNILKENYSFGINFQWAERKVVVYALTFLLLGFLSKFTGLLDKWLLLKHMSIRDVGIYYITFTFINFIPIILKSINRIFAPNISEIWEQKNTQELQKLYHFFTKWTLILSYPIVFFIIVFNKELMLLFGSDFESGKWVLIILTIAHSISIMFGSVRTILQMTDKHVNIFLVEVFRTIFVITLMLILVPRFQMEGAAFALGLGIVINNIINYLILYKHLKITPYNKNFGQLIIFIVLTTIILILFFNMLTNIILISQWYWMVFSMIFIFITTLLISRILCFSKQDKEVLSNIFKKNK
tara:strand:+ start:179 stop:1708 length:1530 start_codon:yes stop_codon:yes gene_type:complete